MYRGRADGDLIKMGIVDAPLAGQRRRGAAGEGIFEAEKLRTLLIGLVCTADPAQPPTKAARGLFEGFDFIEGHPHVRSREERGGNERGGGGRVAARRFDHPPQRSNLWLADVCTKIQAHCVSTMLFDGPFLHEYWAVHGTDRQSPTRGKRTKMCFRNVCL